MVTGKKAALLSIVRYSLHSSSAAALQHSSTAAQQHSTVAAAQQQHLTQHQQHSTTASSPQINAAITVISDRLAKASFKLSDEVIIIADARSTHLHLDLQLQLCPDCRPV
jgi:hypothetical protein